MQPVARLAKSEAKVKQLRSKMRLGREKEKTADFLGKFISRLEQKQG